MKAATPERWNLRQEPHYKSLAGRQFAKDFGANLERIRRAHGVSLWEIARRTGKHQRAIRSYELGHSVPRLRMLIRLAEAIGVQPAALVPELVL